ncbi:MAG: patatin-like phospholipase family protein [Bacteroidota bacterium]
MNWAKPGWAFCWDPPMHGLELIDPDHYEMAKEDFLQQEEFQEILERARNLRDSGKEFSDVIDQEGCQYIDLVQEGGGMLGIALVGYTYVLEEAGIRFFGLAGTSAGAINTLLLAGVGKMNGRKSEQILDVLSSQNLFDLVDGDPKIKDILQAFIDETPFKKLRGRILWNIRRIKKSVFEDLGINPGDEFVRWIEQVLSSSEPPVHTLAELKDLRAKSHYPKGLRTRNGKPIEDPGAPMHIITSDITTRSKVRFPELAPLYWGERADQVSPALMVRASISIPVFFKPFEIPDVPGHGEPATGDWLHKLDYRGKIPQTAKFVDGGLLSNFPINVFHGSVSGDIRKPTFGVKLSEYRNKHSLNKNILSLIGSLVNAMRHDGDIEFLQDHPDYRYLICFMDADTRFNWLNFNMPLEKQMELFLHGARHAIHFLEKFSWTEYKQLRKSLGALKE